MTEISVKEAIDKLKRLRIGLATATIDGYRVIEPLSLALSTLEKLERGELVEVAELAELVERNAIKQEAIEQLSHYGQQLRDRLGSADVCIDLIERAVEEEHWYDIESYIESYRSEGERR